MLPPIDGAGMSLGWFSITSVELLLLMLLFIIIDRHLWPYRKQQRDEAR